MRRWNATAGPVVTKVIILLNVLVYIATVIDGGNSSGRGRLQLNLALLGPAIKYNNEWYRLVTAGFVHYGIVHIAFNMAILYRFGEMLEAALGRIRFVALYLSALLAGSFGALLAKPNAYTAGASGAVFGLVAAAAIGLHLRGVDVWQSGIGPLLALNLFLTFAIPDISIGAHLGGLAGGALAGWFMLRVPTKSASKRAAVIQGVAVAALLSVIAVAGSAWAVNR